MKLGLQLPYFTYPGGPEQLGPVFARIVRDAEAAGLYSFWLMDHHFQIGGWGRNRGRCWNATRRWATRRR